MSCCWTARSIGGGQHDELLVDSTTSCGWSPRWITGGQLDELLVDSAMKSSWTARRAAGGRHHELLVDSTMSCWWILLVIIERQQIVRRPYELSDERSYTVKAGACNDERARTTRNPFVKRSPKVICIVFALYG
ncbi:hypothetical protein Tcan_06262 [Toxocara canis]|uniref:Uncharacterized protein n=1 Tax=Toxocara canis TaxID=6265 RepID=A0A0B2UQX3_TOXCA|nr:hypothetical protein Tcan_06262 [Toxocara canis]